MMHFSDNQNKILLSLSNALFFCNNDIKTDDVGGLINESIRQGVSLLIADEITIDPDNPYFEKLTELKNVALKRNMQISWAHKYATGRLKEAGIPYVILKGLASSRYYPNPELRLLGDVDILIPEDKMQEAATLFCTDGYELTHKEHERHIVLVKKSVRIELHRTVTGIPKGESGNAVVQYFADVFERCEEYDAMSVPCDFHHLLILLLHTAHHIKENGIGLRQLCDYAVFVNRYSKADFDRCYKEKLQKIGIYDFSLILADASKRCFGYPDFPDYETQLSEKLVCDILQSGSFGNKNPVNIQQTLFSENGALETASEIVFSKWKATKKYPVLLPLGYVYYGGRFILRSIFGKREKISIKQAKKNAENRRKLYNSLRIFKGKK